MSSFARGRRSPKGRRKPRPNLPPPLVLPKTIRDELRMCVALQGFSSLREGVGKTQKQQWNSMEQFFHGRDGTAPSQIKMMAEGVGRYKELYEEKKKSTIITSRNAGSKKKKNTPRYFLKQSLSRDDSRLYYQGSDISFNDLEKKIVPVVHYSMEGN